MSCYQTMPFRIEEDMGQFIKEANEPFVKTHKKSEEKNRNKNEKMIMFFEASPYQIQAIQIYYHYENEFLIHQFNISKFGLGEWDEECKRHVTKSKNILLVHQGKKL